jgi:branched-chain amino acid transport system permease protein
LASPATFYLATLVIFCLCFLANAVLVASPIGVSLQGTRDQPRRMSALGYNVWLIRFIAILISGFWASVSGFLFIYFNQFVSPHVMSLSASAEALLMVIVGGAGTLFGPVIGALVLVIIKNVASAYIDQWNAVLGTIFIAIIVFMPDGLVPGLVRLARSTPVIGKLLIAPEPGATVGDA